MDIDNASFAWGYVFGVSFSLAVDYIFFILRNK